MANFKIDPQNFIGTFTLVVRPTDQTIVVDGVPVRVWVGYDMGMVPLALLVHRIVAVNDAGAAVLDALFHACNPPEKVEENGK